MEHQNNDIVPGHNVSGTRPSRGQPQHALKPRTHVKLIHVWSMWPNIPGTLAIITAFKFPSERKWTKNNNNTCVIVIRLWLLLPFHGCTDKHMYTERETALSINVKWLELMLLLWENWNCSFNFWEENFQDTKKYVFID